MNHDPFESNPYAVSGNPLASERARSWLKPMQAELLFINLVKLLCGLPFAATSLALLTQVSQLGVTRLILVETGLLLLHPFLLALAGLFFRQQQARWYLLAYLLWSVQKSWQSESTAFFVSIAFTLALLAFHHWLQTQRHSEHCS